MGSKRDRDIEKVLQRADVALIANNSDRLNDFYSTCQDAIGPGAIVICRSPFPSDHWVTSHVRLVLDAASGTRSFYVPIAQIPAEVAAGHNPPPPTIAVVYVMRLEQPTIMYMFNRRFDTEVVATATTGKGITFRKLDFGQVLLRAVQANGGCLVTDVLGKNISGENADYFFQHIPLVAELKELEEDQTQRFNRKVNAAYKTWVTNGLVPALPNPITMQSSDLPDSCQREVREIWREPIMREIRKANSQLRESKRALKMVGAPGLMILVNNANRLLDPSHIGHILSTAFAHVPTEGRRRYSEIDRIFFVTGNVPVEWLEHAKVGHLIMCLEPPDSRHVQQEFIEQFTSSIQGICASAWGIEQTPGTVADEEVIKLMQNVRMREASQ